MNISSYKYNTPYSCYINLTSKCNLRCKHCFGGYSVSIKNELNLDEWKKVINNLVKIKVFFVNISGGEPTQSPYFKEFISYLTKKGMHFILTTNGVFSKDIRNFIMVNREYLIGIKISLDGPDAESHGFIRKDCSGKLNVNIFKVTLNNIKYFKKRNVPITISTVIHKGNINKTDKFLELIKKVNPISWFISPIIFVGRGGENREVAEVYESFDLNFWNELVQRLRKERINVRLIDCSPDGEKGLSYYECAAAMNMCEIHSDGTISPCTLSRVCISKEFMKFENIKDKSLQDIWDGEVFNRFRNYMNKGCNGCKMLSKCNKCIAQSFRYFGDGISPTPYCIKNGEMLGLKYLSFYKNKLKNNFGMEF